MEKKNMQRIVGVLVIVALVIIVMPFLFGKNDFPAPQAENSKDATTPAQPTDMAANADSADAALGQSGTTDSSNSNPETNSPQHLSDATNANNQMSPDALPGDTNTTPADSLNSKPSASATNSSMTSTSNASASTTNNAKTAALPVPEALSPAIKPAKTAANTAPAGTLLPNTAANSTTQATAVVKPVADVKKVETAVPAQAAQTASSNNTTADSDAIVIGKDGSATVTHAPATQASHKKHVHTISSHAPIKAKSVKAKMAKANLSKKHLAKNSKSPAWVIQMGSFNNKNNATRLMTKLRAAGFKVFAHEFKSASGKVSTRVYVGPEVKEASATKLSASVHQKVNMQGIVVLFKPVV